MRENKESARFVRVEGKVSIWQPGFATLGFHARMMVILPCHKHCNEHFMCFFDIVMFGASLSRHAQYLVKLQAPRGSEIHNTMCF